MTVEELVRETVEYYKTHNRGYEQVNSRCVYRTPQGDMCAIGRCLVDDSKIFKCLSGITSTTPSRILERDLKPQYKGFPLEVWENLQALHDRSQHWTLTQKGNRLTKDGKIFIKQHFGFDYDNKGISK